MHFYGFYWNTLVINCSIQELLEVEFPKGSKKKVTTRVYGRQLIFPVPYPVLSVTSFFFSVGKVLRPFWVSRSWAPQKPSDWSFKDGPVFIQFHQITPTTILHNCDLEMTYITIQKCHRVSSEPCWSVNPSSV